MSKEIKNIEARIVFDSNKKVSSIDVQYVIHICESPDMSKKASIDKTEAYTDGDTLSGIMDDIISSINATEKIV